MSIEVAGKIIEWSAIPSNILQGLKPRTQFVGIIGTSKLVSFYKARGVCYFSAACNVVP